MVAHSSLPRLTDIIEAIEHIRSVMAGVTLDAFEVDWQKRWLVERGVEIMASTQKPIDIDWRRRSCARPRQQRQSWTRQQRRYVLMNPGNMSQGPSRWHARC